MACSTSFHVRFAGLSLLHVLRLPISIAIQPCRKLPTNSVFGVCSGNGGMLRRVLGRMVGRNGDYVVPSGSFVRRMRDNGCFPVSKRVIPVRSHKRVANITLSYRGISSRRVQGHFFSLTVRSDSVCP